MGKLKEQFITYYLGDTSADEVCELINNRNIEEFIQWSIDNKVLSVSFPLIQKRLKSLELSNKKSLTCLKKAEEIYYLYKNRRDLIIRNLKELKVELDSIKGGYAYLKGLAFEQYYPEGLERFTNDIDLVIENKDDLTHILKIGNAKGYEHSSLPTIRRDVSSNSFEEYIGLFKLQGQDEDEEFCWEFDLGGFTITDITHIPSKVILSETNMVCVGETELSIPTIENHLLILLGELVTRPTLYDRDVIDFLLLLKELETCKLPILKENINTYKLQGELHRVLERIMQLPIDLVLLTNQEVASFLAEFYKKYSRSSQDRVFNEHILSYLREFREDDVLQRDYHYFYERNRLTDIIDLEDDECIHLNDLLEFNQRFSSPYQQLVNGHHVFLIQLNSECYRKWEFERIDAFEFLKAPSGLYWLSQEGIETDTSYSKIEQLMSELIC